MLVRAAVLGAILISALSGCTLSPITYHDRPKDYDGPTGYVVGSMIKDSRGEDPSPNGGVGWLLMGSPDEAWSFNVAVHVDAPPLASKWDFEEEDVRGFVFLIPVAPGEYAIKKVGGHFAFSSYFMNEEFSLPFTVEAGKSTYIGEYTLRGDLAGEWIGPYFTVSRNVDRDYELLAARFPEFDPARTTESYPEKTVLFSVIRIEDFGKIVEVAKSRQTRDD